MQPHLAERVVRLPVLMPFLGHEHKNINSTVDEVGVRKGKGSSVVLVWFWVFFFPTLAVSYFISSVSLL